MRILVTGGGGFLGSALAKALIQQGHQVRSFSRGAYPQLESLGIEVIRGDLADEQALVAAAKGCDLVFHVAAMAGIWGSPGDYFRTNVLGTRNVIAACRCNTIGRLVFTSSPSVVFDGTDQEKVDESVTYPKRFLAQYARTKALAEKLVLDADNENLATVALRPHLIWGPGDRHLIPRIITRAKRGQLRLVGDGSNLVDSTYIDNAVAAHILASERLSPGSPVSGKAYFISNGEPLPMGDLMNKILQAAHLPPLTRSVPAGVAYGAGAIIEVIYRLLRRSREPRMTRFLALELSRAHWFDISAAKRDLGYRPTVSIDEGMKTLEEWLVQTASHGWPDHKP